MSNKIKQVRAAIALQEPYFILLHMKPHYYIDLTLFKVDKV